VRRILEGTKRFEFRRKIFARRNIERIYIYSSSPVNRLVGLFNADEILEGTPTIIWRQCREFAGIDAPTFFDYFRGRRKGFAIGIDGLMIFGRPIDPRSLGVFVRPPQSFCYLNETVEHIISSTTAKQASREASVMGSEYHSHAVDKPNRLLR
jgi:type I restriction enzyme S subunit